jgi:SAM-dependent methyltransferase
MSMPSTGRAQREQAASNSGEVYELHWQNRQRFAHVHECPNSVYADARYERLLSEAVRGKRVLDFGCGNGYFGRKLLALGASHVHGIDISDGRIAEAREAARGEPRLTYEVADATASAGGPFDVIVAIAILHHLDWRRALRHMHDGLLAPGGAMIISEPLGSNLALRLYWALFPKAHTEDEAPFYRSDIRWLRRAFPSLEFYPVNYVSLYTGIMSSLIFQSADNALMRLSDRLDRMLEKIEFMKPAFRYGLFIIRKPTDTPQPI